MIGTTFWGTFVFPPYLLEKQLTMALFGPILFFLTNVNWLYRAELHKMFSIQLSKVISLKKTIYLPFLCPGMMVMVCGTVTNLLVFCGFQSLKNAHIIIWGVIEMKPFLYDFYKLIFGKSLRYHTHTSHYHRPKKNVISFFPFFGPWRMDAV